MIRRAVAHADLVDPLNTGQRRTERSGHVAADCEQPRSGTVVEFGEVVGVRLPHHDGVSGNAGIGGEHDSDVCFVGDQMLRAEDVSAGQLLTLVTNAAFVQVEHTLADFGSSLLPLGELCSGGFEPWCVGIGAGVAARLRRHSQDPCSPCPLVLRLPGQVQIDGLSGTGKSSLAAEFSDRGYCAVDADAEFAYFGDPATGRPTDLLTRGHWIWNLARIRSFCEASHKSPIFICGGALNQGQCADLFTHRFMLRVDDETMRHRLVARTSNDFGKGSRELAEQLELNGRASSAAHRTSWTVVDATRPPIDVADVILNSIH